MQLTPAENFRRERIPTREDESTPRLIVAVQKRCKFFLALYQKNFAPHFQRKLLAKRLLIFKVARYLYKHEIKNIYISCIRVIKAIPRVFYHCYCNTHCAFENLSVKYRIGTYNLTEYSRYLAMCATVNRSNWGARAHVCMKHGATFSNSKISKLYAHMRYHRSMAISFIIEKFIARVTHSSLFSFTLHPMCSIKKYCLEAKQIKINHRHLIVRIIVITH